MLSEVSQSQEEKFIHEVSRIDKCIERECGLEVAGEWECGGLLNG